MSKKNTIPFLNRYEYAALIAARASEIADGKPLTIQNPGTTDPIKIAIMEYNSGKLPKKVIRTFPNGTTEVWNLNDLQCIQR
jgi:DNA-directed RNA polymerase subunit K/omega